MRDTDGESALAALGFETIHTYAISQLDLHGAFKARWNRLYDEAAAASAGSSDASEGAIAASLVPMPRLLVVHHSPTRGVSRLTESALAGARDDAIEGVEVVVRPALEATAADVLAADGYLLGTPANFGYMSGALKHFFDSTFLAIGGALSDDGSAGGPSEQAGTRGRPFALYVHGRYDTEGAVRSVLSIVTALQWRQAAEVLEVMGDVTEQHADAAYELGATVAALLSDR
jgi:multimeric flavodoxin WrbA